MTDNNPVIQGYELTGLGFDLLFGSTTREQSNLKLLALQIIDTKQYLALIEAKHNFDAMPTHENAVAFNGAYSSYLDFKLYGLDFIAQFGENTISDSLAGYLTKFASGEQQQLVKDFTDKARIQSDLIQSQQRILDNYHDIFEGIHRSADTVYHSQSQIVYCTHVQNLGWQDWKSDGEISGTEGQRYRLEGIEIESDLADVGVEYRTHVQNIGWQDWRSDGEMSGTEGLSYRLESIEIKLTGAKAESFDIYYQVHAQNYGWLDWAKNGDSAGTAGKGLRLEAIRIVVVPAGSAAPGPTAQPFIS